MLTHPLCAHHLDVCTVRYELFHDRSTDRDCPPNPPLPVGPSKYIYYVSHYKADRWRFRFFFCSKYVYYVKSLKGSLLTFL
jgi:hypothetical protein